MKGDKAIALKNLVRSLVRAYQKSSQHRLEGLGWGEEMLGGSAEPWALKPSAKPAGTLIAGTS